MDVFYTYERQMNVQAKIKEKYVNAECLSNASLVNYSSSSRADIQSTKKKNAVKNALKIFN